MRWDQSESPPPPKVALDEMHAPRPEMKMLSLTKTDTLKPTLAERIRSDVTSYMYEAFSREASPLSNLDRWTQSRISSENLAKLALVLDADDSIEYCYQNLIREIDTEAEAGVFLVRPGTRHPVLKSLVGEAGVSAKLYQQIDAVAPKLFPDELVHSNENLDLVWVTIQARHDRAVVDARVSEIILKHLMDSTNGAKDMSAALRSLLYAFHEDLARRQCELALVLNERATRDLVMMVSELAERAGDYAERVQDISHRADRL